MLIIRQLLGVALFTTFVFGVLVALHAIPELLFTIITGR
jgi:hypothetical protein